MASVNKASLREEFAALKGQFERLCAEGQVTGEIQALVQALLMLFGNYSPPHRCSSTRLGLST